MQIFEYFTWFGVLFVFMIINWGWDRRFHIRWKVEWHIFRIKICGGVDWDWARRSYFDNNDWFSAFWKKNQMIRNSNILKLYFPQITNGPPQPVQLSSGTTGERGARAPSGTDPESTAERSRSSDPTGNCGPRWFLLSTSRRRLGIRCTNRRKPSIRKCRKVSTVLIV